MPLKFRLKGLAETFVDIIRCPQCGHDGGDQGDQSFYTDLTKVTYDGIIVVIQCGICGLIFVPEEQRLGVLDFRKLRAAVDKDGVTTGQPVYSTLGTVKLDVEKLNAARNDAVH